MLTPRDGRDANLRGSSELLAFRAAARFERFNFLARLVRITNLSAKRFRR